jgi:DUF1365 family protein
MKRASEALYIGTVVHRRVRPVTHKLRYSVFAVLFDCERLEGLDWRHRLLSYNRFNLVSLYDRDHGDGTPLEDYLKRIATSAGKAGEVSRFVMLCYPRILGYVFNPLTVYFGLNAEDRVRLVIYEVNNTFGERMTYVLPAEPDENGIIAQSCRKRLYVSPFNDNTGTYSFHASSPDADMTVGVALRDETGPLLNAYFHGQRKELSDGTLLKALARTGWMTVKVMAGIHYEAARLWLKGMRLRPRPARPATEIRYINAPKENH